MYNTAQDAIHAALSGNWERAVMLNKQLLEEEPLNLQSLLRLSNALLELGLAKEAQKYAKQAATHHPDSPLAKRCFERALNCTENTNKQPMGKTNLKAFLETPGKTRLVRLLHLGEPKVIAQLHPGEQVKLLINTRKVSVETDDGLHIGHVPDDIAARISGAKKSQFGAYVKKRYVY